MIICKGIMIVDDDHEDHAILKDTLQDLNASEPLFLEKDGLHAINSLENLYNNSSLPSLLIVDLNMPRMGGTQLLRQLKNDKRFNKIPVIIYSTSINPLEKEQCISLGAHSYITKPLSYSENIEVAKLFMSLSNKLSITGL